MSISASPLGIIAIIAIACLAAWSFLRKEPQVVQPEHGYVVTITESAISCTHPNGIIQTINRGDISSVKIHTTSDGPMLPDFFWVISDTRNSCTVPQGAIGEKELLNILLALPNFDYEEMGKASCSTDENYFTCWGKLQAPTT